MPLGGGSFHEDMSHGAQEAVDEALHAYVFFHCVGHQSFEGPANPDPVVSLNP